jgi:outer membrane lipoprotein carrier protein
MAAVKYSYPIVIEALRHSWARAIVVPLMVMAAQLGTAAPAAASDLHEEDPFAPDRQALSQRLQEVAEFTATFTQSVFGVRGEVLERSEGYVRLQRPRFKWVVNEPYPQILVTEGEQLKMYDPDLEQLTVRPLEEALEDTPVSLLTRDGVELTDDFHVMRIGDSEGDSFVIEPTADDTLYREILLHFGAEGLTGLDILDHLGQRTEIRFEADPDAIMDETTFTLEVPPGTDVIGG